MVSQFENVLRTDTGVIIDVVLTWVSATPPNTLFLLLGSRGSNNTQ